MSALASAARIRAVMALVGLAALGWVIFQFLASHDSLADAVTGVRLGGVAGAVAAMTLGLGLGAITWWWMMRRLGFPAPLLATVDVWLTSNLWKYLPGQVWMAVGRVVGAPRSGAPRRMAIVATGLEQAVSLCAAGVVLAATTLPLALGAAIALVPIGIALFALPALAPPIARRFTLERAEPFVARPLVVGLYAAALLNTALGIASFSSVLSAVGAFRAEAWSSYAAAWITAFFAGYLAFGAPAGLGVREAVLFGLLRDAGVAAGPAAQAALLSRCLLVVTEFSCSAAVAALERGTRPRS